MIEGGPPKNHPRKTDMVSEKMPSQEEFSKYNSFMQYRHTYIYMVLGGALTLLSQHCYWKVRIMIFWDQGC